MSKQIFVRHTYWTLNYQDGRASDTKYESKAEAEVARKKLPLKGRGICVMVNYENKPLEDCL